MRSAENKTKPITGKKITYSSTINDKNNKHTRQGNEFQLIYKIKNRENENLEDSFQSMILLKSKNKIKRYPDINKDDKEKRKNDDNHNIKDVFDRISSKIQQHSNKASPRIINLLSMSKTSPRSHFISEPKIQSTRIKRKSKTKDMFLTLNRPQTTKSDKIIKKTKKHVSSQPTQQNIDKQTEYILFENQIHPIAQQTQKNLTSLMKSTYDKSKLTINPFNENSYQNQSQGDQQVLQHDQQYNTYEQSAKKIQKVWRGYVVRKSLASQEQQNKANKLRTQTSVNGMFIELFQEIVDMDQEDTKIELLKSFRNVIKNRESINSGVTEKHQYNIVAQRQNAIETEFQAQTCALKCLLVSKTIDNDDYLSRVEQLSKWGSMKRQELQKLEQFIEQAKTQTREICNQTQQLNNTLQNVQLLREQPESLLKFYEKIQKQTLSFGFYQSSVIRPNTSGEIATPTSPIKEDSPNLQNLVQQFEFRQKTKAQIEKRMLQQLGYMNSDISPVNSSNIGIHLFLSDILCFIEENYKQQFLRWINMPYGFSVESRLKLLQGYDLKGGKQVQGLVEGVQNVLSLQILIEYHRELYTSQDLFNIYHQRAVFDAFNQCLNIYRPYFSIKGPPYLWNNSQKALTFYYIAEQNIQQVFQKTKQQVLKHASTLCGILTEESTTSLPFDDLISLKHGCHQMIAQYRDEKINKMENFLVFSSDNEWMLIEEQKTQTMLNLSQLLLSEIIKEAAKDINDLFNQ